MTAHIYVQAAYRRMMTYGRAPNAIDISYVSLKTPPKIDYTTIADQPRIVSWSN